MSGPAERPTIGITTFCLPVKSTGALDDNVGVFCLEIVRNEEVGSQKWFGQAILPPE
jgi:hypothetical protein